MQDGLKRILDYSDYLAAPDDGKRYEILSGELLVTPSPRPVHQRVVARLGRILSEHFERRGEGEVFLSPIDLILTNHDVLQPDLLVVDDRTQITERGIEGAPLLIAEVLSRKTADRDRGLKALRYAALGVRHYWLVDPDARRVQCYMLARGAFDRTAEAEEDATLPVPGLDGLDLPLAELWAESPAP